MSEPICIWIACTNRVQLFSREYGISVCNRDCLALYIRYKESVSKGSERFKELWFIHISLLQQIFYEAAQNFNTDGETIKKLKKELAFNNQQIANMAVGAEQILMDGLTSYTGSTLKLFQKMLSAQEDEKIKEEEKEWKKKPLDLLSILQLTEEPTLVAAMKDYSKNLLDLMESVVQRSNSHHCIFKLLVISVANLSSLIQSRIAKVSPQVEPKTMMLRPENGRRQKKY